MNFQITWVPEPEQEANLWLNSANRQAITTAAYEIEQRLRTNPIDVGESRSGGWRILLMAPLGITFSVNLQGHCVSVLQVWQFSKRV